MPDSKGTTNGTTNTQKRVRVQVDCSKDGRTHQSFKDECDINRIMARHRKTGLVRQRTDRPQYGDFSNVGDYQNALNTITTANAMFAELAAPIRERFNNNPQAFLDFCEDPDNQAEAIDLGIASAPAPEPAAAAIATETDTGENPIVGGE